MICQVLWLVNASRNCMVHKKGEKPASMMTMRLEHRWRRWRSHAGQPLRRSLNIWVPSFCSRRIYTHTSICFLVCRLLVFIHESYSYNFGKKRMWASVHGWHTGIFWNDISLHNILVGSPLIVFMRCLIILDSGHPGKSDTLFAFDTHRHTYTYLCGRGVSWVMFTPTTWHIVLLLLSYERENKEENPPLNVTFKKNPIVIIVHNNITQKQPKKTSCSWKTTPDYPYGISISST